MTTSKGLTKGTYGATKRTIELRNFKHAKRIKKFNENFENMHEHYWKEVELSNKARRKVAFAKAKKRAMKYLG